MAPQQPPRRGIIARTVHQLARRVARVTADGTSGLTSNFQSRNAAYDAANWSGPRTGNWMSAYGGPNAVMGWSLQMLRSRSREKTRNDWASEAIIDTIVTNLIGTGIRPQFRTKSPALNGILTQMFNDWILEADADGRVDYYGQQALACGSMLEGGDCFGRRRIRRLDDGLTVPLQIQLLEGEYCPVEWNRRSDIPNGYVQQGVEFGPINQRLAYWLWKQHPEDLIQRQFLDPNAGYAPVRVTASDVMHLASMRRPGAIRGEPWLVRALIKVHDFDKYNDAQLVRQQIAALFAAFRYTENSPWDTDTGDPDEQPTEYGVDHPVLEPGTVQSLDPGEKITFTTPPGPGNDYDVYMKHQERQIAAAGKIMYEQLTGDYAGGNDRTYRAAASEFRRRMMRLQGNFVFQWCVPSLSWWVDIGILAGNIKLPAGIEAKDVKRVRWCPQAWDYINPQQDVEARIRERRAGFKSRHRIITEDGGDPQETDNEIDRENREGDKKGFVFDSDARFTSTRGVAQPAASAELVTEVDDPASEERGNGGKP